MRRMKVVLEEISLAPREIKLTTRTNTIVRRTLPHKDLLMIGAWCFIDHYGPTKAVGSMSVARHPHTGLQTVSWLFDGQIEHRDSLGSIQVIEPGQLNLMTSGYGIAHSELSVDSGNDLHGVQLWVALPAESKDVAPNFEHLQDLPVFDVKGLIVKLFIGEWMGFTSAAKIYSPLLGAEISGGALDIELLIEPGFEYGILLDEGELRINGNLVRKSQLHYIPKGRSVIQLQSKDKFRGLILGGSPFNEEIIMWWNFIGRSYEEIIEMRNDWQNQTSRFKSFEDKIGGFIPAPELPNLVLKPRGSQRH